jgi:hypothetical protein
MASSQQRLPKYRHYQPKNLDVVRIDGRDVYLGRYGSSESREKYRRVVAEWLTGSPTAPATVGSTPGDSAPSVDELILAFMTRHAANHYRHADGTPTGELDNFRDNLKPLQPLYGTTSANCFSPRTLRAVRQSMIEAGLSRRMIN